MRDVDAGSSGTMHREFRAELGRSWLFGFSFEQHTGIAVAWSV
jgi:hypothetical protein